MKAEWVYVAISVYLVGFAGVVVGLFLWKIRRKGGRRPVDFKLLRGPGETLRRRIKAFDEDFALKMLFLSLVPLFLTALLLGLTSKLGIKTWTQLGSWIGFVVAIFTGAASLIGRWAWREMVRYRGDALGYLGEREVAEWLQPLCAKGYQIFHDVPGAGRKADFNLDHVAVGPTGVTVVETKTRRKGRARPDGSEYYVRYDGQFLHWPWGPERDTLNQVTAQADWVRKLIKQRTLIEVPVRPVIAIPGWWVEGEPTDVYVVNAKNVANAVEHRREIQLSPEEIKLISIQLDTLCRDVEE